jgi:hypothetical protein
MADEQQVLQEAAKLPLSEQIAHTSWKARAQALSTIQQKLSRAFSCEDEIFSEAGAWPAPPAASCCRACTRRSPHALGSQLQALFWPRLRGTRMQT